MCQRLRHVPQVSAYRSLLSVSEHLNPGNFRKKILVRIFAGPIWEGKLLEFVDTFTKRRKEFEFALTIHNTVGVDAANLKLNTIDERTAELSRRYLRLLYAS